MGKASAKEAHAQTQTPATARRTMKTTTPSTSKSDQIEDQDAIIQRMVDEQLFRELNAVIQVEFREDRSKAITSTAQCALEVAEKTAHEVLGMKPSLSGASLEAAKKDENRLKGELAASDKYAGREDADEE